MAFDLTGYVTVPERLTAAKAAYPDGRFQSRIVEHSFPGFLAVEAKFYRTADDPTPAVGLAWEPVPGKTTFTKDSELQNAETSAWGRALIAALVADASGGVASQEEVRNRSQNGETTSRPVTPDDRLEDGSFPKVCPACGSDVWDNVAGNDVRVLEGKKRTPEYKCKSCPWLSWEQDAFRPGGSVDDTVTSLGVKVEKVPIPDSSQWDHLLDMCKVFKAWTPAEQADMAIQMCDTLGFDAAALKAKQPEKVFLKLSERYYVDQPDEAPF